MKDVYLIRFVQANETFRQPELEALGKRANVKFSIIEFKNDSPFCELELGPVATDDSQVLSTADDAAPCKPQTPDRQALDALAASFISRSVLSKGIFQIWGKGTDYESLHADIKAHTTHLWPAYRQKTFKFSFDSLYGKRSISEQRRIINTFAYLGFSGTVTMKDPEVEFVIMEEWESDIYSNSRPRQSQDSSHDAASESVPVAQKAPRRIFFGRLIGGTQRALIDKHDLKKRPYISTTSMDAQLALITASLALAGPGKLFLDPFVGTGGFMVAASELGALTLGSDIDGRSYRGKGRGVEKGVGANFKKYKLQSLFGDCLTADLTNSPFRRCVRGGAGVKSDGKKESKPNGARWLDGIISDPPYGIREGMKVLGHRASQAPAINLVSTSTASTEAGPTAMSSQPLTLENESGKQAGSESQGETKTKTKTKTKSKTSNNSSTESELPSYKQADYIAPKRPYSFTSMLDDILDFSATTLIDGGRLAFWMPSVNDNDNNDSTTLPDSLLSLSSNEKERKTPIPQHPNLKLIHTCTQSFNKWSRLLLVYERLPGDDQYTDEEDDRREKKGEEEKEKEKEKGKKTTADELNSFRRLYFRGFRADS